MPLAATTFASVAAALLPAFERMTLPRRSKSSIHRGGQSAWKQGLSAAMIACLKTGHQVVLSPMGRRPSNRSDILLQLLI